MREKDEKQAAELKNRILDQLDLTRELSDGEIFRLIDEAVLEKSGTEYIPLSRKRELRRELFYSIRKLDLLQELVEDPEVTEIMVNGPDCIFVEKRGKLQRFEKSFDSVQKLEDVVQQIVSYSNRTVSRANPIADARLSNGARVNVVLDPIALNGPAVTIRRFPQAPITMEQLKEWGSISEEAADFLSLAVRAGYNIFVSGGTGSGKTTFLNALSASIPKDERLITIEDNAELQIRGVDNLVRLEARSANLEGENEISIRSLIRTALRMRPDRIIVGEVRGEEAIDMLQAMNTGHDGSLSTGHANSPRDMLSRLETMVLMGMNLPLEAIIRQIASAIDILVHLGRLRDGSRRVLEVAELTGCHGSEIQLNTLYAFREIQEKNSWKVKGILEKKNELQAVEKMQAAGFWSVAENELQGI